MNPVIDRMLDDLEANDSKQLQVIETAWDELDAEVERLRGALVVAQMYNWDHQSWCICMTNDSAACNCGRNAAELLAKSVLSGGDE